MRAEPFSTSTRPEAHRARASSEAGDFRALLALRYRCQGGRARPVTRTRRRLSRRARAKGAANAGVARHVAQDLEPRLGRLRALYRPARKRARQPSITLLRRVAGATGRPFEDLIAASPPRKPRNGRLMRELMRRASPEADARRESAPRRRSAKGRAADGRALGARRARGAHRSQGRGQIDARASRRRATRLEFHRAQQGDRARYRLVDRRGVLALWPGWLSPARACGAGAGAWRARAR